MLINFHDGCLVITSITIIRSREDGHDILIMHFGVTVHGQLMGSGDLGETVGVIELLRDLLAEEVPGSSGGDAPGGGDVVGIGPEKVAHGSLVRHLLLSLEGTDRVQSVQTRGQTSVEGEDFSLDQGTQGEIVEHFGEVAPDVRITVLPDGLVVETVHLGGGSALVVTSGEGDPIGVPNLQSEEEGYTFDTEESSIDVVSEEEVIGLGRFSSDFE